MRNTAFQSNKQHTLKKTVTCEGIGLHSGAPVLLTLEPAEPFTGIHFIRTDLETPLEFAATATLVGETKLGTSLTHPSGETLSTVEHLMAAFWGSGIDNAIVYVNGPEVPIMDGSSTPFLELIATVGVKKQNAERRIYEIESPITLELDGSEIEILPYDGFAVEVAIDFDHDAIGQQALLVDFSETAFAGAMSDARTFGFLNEVEYLKTIGLARGGSLENAVVLDGKNVMNPEGLRSDDEFVQHKALDLVGDLFLCGGRIRGLVRAHKPGHTINTAMARKIIEHATAAETQTSKPRYEAPTPAMPTLDGTLPAFA
ncbi:MAG: UDP-3-O-acyl-N-acetylglucosamine deacetylase [Rickettsiales bacterium]|nr:UDP-3-O-acyl-N-acetylglucosamine deacetylase [Rickettsiales bacterium]